MRRRQRNASPFEILIPCLLPAKFFPTAPTTPAGKQTSKSDQTQTIMSNNFLVTSLSLIGFLAQAVVPLFAMANFTTAAAPTMTTSLMPKDSREFFLRTYAPDEPSPDDAFCYKMASTCPFLASRTARPTSSTNVKVRVRVDFWLTHFAGIDDLNQQ